MKFFKTLLPALFIGFSLFAQNPDSVIIRKIYDEALSNGHAYKNLEYLCKQIGPRLSGSTNAQKSVDWTKKLMEDYGFDRVYLQELMVPVWERGAKEEAYILDGKIKIPVPIAALGGSIATSAKGITAPILEVQNFEELKALGADIVKGKIIFFNRPFDPKLFNTFSAYSGAVNQRSQGAIEAAKLGAVGVIVRSMSSVIDDFPHTGGMVYQDGVTKIPGAAISTKSADLLSQKLKANPGLKFYFKQSCEQMEDVLSYNVVGELKGSEYPDNIMVVGGHLDSWDLADGSHDDGAGVVQSMEALHIFKSLGYKTKNTIRVVLFMNEENGGRGGKMYAELAKTNKENHIFALESDSGGFSPRGFSIEADDANFQRISSWKNLFEPYLIHSFVKGGAGADINPLSSGKIVKAGLKPDSQRYFDYHHALNDNFDAINKRELELGAATMTSLLYLIDQNGIME
jgi:hypothetical protein